MSETTLPVSLQKDPYVVPTPVKKKKDLDMETFMRLLTVQLANQNPLEPMNDRDFFAQMAQLGQVEGMDKLNKQANIDQAQTLMGKRITAARSGATTDPTKSPTVEGIVRRLAIINGNHKLMVEEADGGLTEVDINSIQSVQPQKSVHDFNYLIGKRVSGTENGKTVSGTVTALSSIDGKIMAELTNQGGKVQIAVDNVSQING
jgi:flagellar basal-body rod modification protein FlgD